MIENNLSQLILKAAFKVHANLGPGLLANAYERCLYHELKGLGLRVERKKDLPLTYSGKQLDISYQVDLLVEGRVVLAIKSVDKFTEVHAAEVRTHLKLSGCQVGFLFNFNVRTLKHGVRRVLHHPLNATAC